MLGVPEPSIRFCIDVDCPNKGLERNGTGSANVGWLRTLNISFQLPPKSRERARIPGEDLRPTGSGQRGTGGWPCARPTSANS